MSGTLNGKVALVTGASSGIGEAAALDLAAAGAKVAVSGRRKERLDDLVKRIEAAGGVALALPGDVSIEADATASVEDTIAKFGRLDILVNSAGVNEAGGIESLPIEQWRRVIDINLMGTIYTCRAAFPHMKAQGSGDIVNISSTAGRRAGWRFASYSTSKFGLTGFTESLRQECGPVGVRVSIVEPGATATEIASSISDPAWRDMIQQHTHKDGAMQPQDIVDAIMLVVQLPRRANVTRILVQPTIDVEPMP
ncbi:SDR family NAD(P)-dependent oxidoreductase [Phenylobacterium sp. LjRoot219]|uniref:SDR family oxidoreductase n=1 Tax=Phenylobacterium sp. LjRoot219 TaxID=3342283 RepID=UPI003ECF391B